MPRGAQWVLSRRCWVSSAWCSLSLPLQKEKLSAQASLKRHTSLNDLSLTRDEQEIEFLRLQVLEQQHVIDDLSLVRPLSATALGVVPGDVGVRHGIGASGRCCRGRAGLTELSPATGTFPPYSAGKQPRLCLNGITGARGGFHGYSLFHVVSLVCCHKKHQQF